MSLYKIQKHDEKKQQLLKLMTMAHFFSRNKNKTVFLPFHFR